MNETNASVDKELNQTADKDTQPSKKPAKEQKKKRKRKLIWRVLRFFLVPFLCIAGLFAGLVIGYVYIGKQPLSDVWSLDTWKHVFDLVFLNT